MKNSNHEAEGLSDKIQKQGSTCLFANFFCFYFFFFFWLNNNTISLRQERIQG